MNQKKLIKESINYLKKIKKNKIDVTLSPFCYLISWSNSLGNIKLRFLSKKNIKINELIFIFFREIITIGYNNNFTIAENNRKVKKRYKNIIVSWCSKNNFNNRGEYYDTYLNIKDKENYHWFLISVDNFIPRYLQNNLSIIYKNSKSFDLIYLIKVLLKNIIKFGFLSKRFWHYFNHSTNSAEVISNIFYKKYINHNVVNLLILFENQPLQHQIINAVKKIGKNNKTIGYLHCFPWPLQTDLIYKNNNLDKLYVSSEAQKNILKNNFLWPEEKINLINSLRYSKKSIINKENYIFLPFHEKNIQLYLKILFDFLEKEPKYFSKKFNIRIHPLNKDNKKFINYKKIIINRLKDLSKANKIISKKAKYSIIIGDPGGTVAECLENDIPIIHVTDNILFHHFDLKLWKNIEITNISHNVYKYFLAKKNVFAKYNNNKNNNLKIVNLIFNA